MKNGIILLKLSLFINIFMVFFGNYITNLFYFQIFGTICIVLLYTITRKRIEINKSTFLWIIYFLIISINLLFSFNKNVSFTFWQMILSLIIIKICYENFNIDWKKIFINTTYLFSFIHLFFTILQFMIPNLVMNINSYLLSPINYSMNLSLLKLGAYAGITAQTAINAFYISIFIIITFSNILLNNEKKIKNLFLLFLGLFGLLITAKRGFILFVIIIMFILYLVVTLKNRKQIIKYIFVFLSIVIIINMIITKIPEARAVFNKMEQLENSGDISNGREILWSKTMNIFNHNKIFGIGLGTIKYQIGEYSHNVYLQLLAETGIIGFSTYLLAIIYSFICTVKNIKNPLIFKTKEYYYSIISLSFQVLYLLYSFTGNPYYNPIFIVMYFISLAMNNVVINDKYSQHKKAKECKI